MGDIEDNLGDVADSITPDILNPTQVKASTSPKSRARRREQIVRAVNNSTLKHELNITSGNPRLKLRDFSKSEPK